MIELPQSMLDANGVFITGTDTNIGKTYVSSLILKSLSAKGHSCTGLKPIASGFEEQNGEWFNDDVQALTQASNVGLPKKIVNRYAFKPAIAPHMAAQQAEQGIDFSLIKQDVDYAQSMADKVIVEGVGGWHVPLNGKTNGVLQSYQDVSDLAEYLNFPIIVVVGIRLGCINHAILTVKAIQATKLPLLGWVANRLEPRSLVQQENIETIKGLLDVPMLFDVSFA